LRGIYCDSNQDNECPAFHSNCKFGLNTLSEEGRGALVAFIASKESQQSLVEILQLYPQGTEVWVSDANEDSALANKQQRAYIQSIRLRSSGNVTHLCLREDGTAVLQWRYIVKAGKPVIPEYTMEELIGKLGYEFKIKK